VPLPEGIGFDEAACFGIPALTALQAVHLAGPLQGTPVLVPGAGNAVGHFVPQLAVLQGGQVIGPAGSATCSQAVPIGRCHCAFHSQTRWPMRSGGTPSPTASMTPAPSLCGTMSSAFSGRFRRDFTSDGLTPEVCINTRTSPGSGIGVGSSPTSRTSWAGPLRRYQAAFMGGGSCGVNQGAIVIGVARRA
jgi:hypothetical protein